MIVKNSLQYNPFVRRDDSVYRVMTDVVIALIPCIAISALAYGFYPIAVILVSIASAVLAEFLFNAVFSKDTPSIGDGSAIITGILLAFTIGPFTPLYIVAIGGASTVLFGKLLWGGLGRNRFNPALLGREFMTIFFPVIMTSRFIWQNKEEIIVKKSEIFSNDILNSLTFNVTGAIGEYSPILLIIGGIYLLFRRRISWHIPFSMLVSFSILLLIFINHDLRFSLGGLFLGAIYMATDMPTSTSTPTAKIYFGAMVGIVCILCLLGGVPNGYFSYSILIMNGFVNPINWVLRPKVWGKNVKLGKRILHTTFITLAIVATTGIVIFLDLNDGIKYVVYGFIIYCIGRFIWLRMQKENKLESYQRT